METKSTTPSGQNITLQKPKNKFDAFLLKLEQSEKEKRADRKERGDFMAQLLLNQQQQQAQFQLQQAEQLQRQQEFQMQMTQQQSEFFMRFFGSKKLEGGKENKETN